MACVGSDPNPTTGTPEGGASSTSSGSPSGSSSGSSGSGDAGGLDAFTPAACSPGTVRCTSAQLEACNAEGTGYVVQKLCETAELCKADNGGSCETPACPSKATRCTGAAFERCNDGRTAWVKERDCASSVYCHADGSGDAGAGCEAPACKPKVKHCDLTCSTIPLNTANDCIKVCKDDGTGYVNLTDCGNAMAGDRCAEATDGDPQCI